MPALRPAPLASTEPLTAAALRRELSARALARARFHPHEVTYGATPCVVFRDDRGRHGNFLDAAYTAILDQPQWAARLGKTYTAAQWIPRRHDRNRNELDCANSSDALLMNIFCYPGMTRHAPLCALLGVERGAHPAFGHKARIPVGVSTSRRPAPAQSRKPDRPPRPLFDRTEIDLLLGDLLLEAKLTETSFQQAPLQRVLRYPTLAEVFDLAELPRVQPPKLRTLQHPATAPAGTAQYNADPEEEFASCPSPPRNSILTFLRNSRHAPTRRPRQHHCQSSPTS